MRWDSVLRLWAALSVVVVAVSGCVVAAVFAAGSGTPHLAASCGSGSAGSAQRRCDSFEFDGHKRSYRLYVPAKVASPAPLLVVLHGGTQSSASMEVQTGKGFNRKADDTGALVVYPDSVGIHWNDGREKALNLFDERHVDDVGFLRALVASLRQQYPIDPQRVFVTGFSNGGMMTLRLACESTDVYRGFVAVAASLPEEISQNCHPATARPVELIDGTADRFVPYEGGGVGLLGGAGRVIGAEATFGEFRTILGCSGVESAPWPQGTPPKDSKVTQHRATGCQDDVQVMLFEIKGGLHVWPGVGDDKPTGLLASGRQVQGLDATEEVWRFLGLAAGGHEAQVSQTREATQ